MTVLNFRGKIKKSTTKATKTGKAYEIQIEARLNHEEASALDDWVDEYADFTIDELQVGHTPMHDAPKGQMTLDDAIRPEEAPLECSQTSEWEITAQKQSTADEPNPPVQMFHACTFHAEQGLIEARRYAGEFGTAIRRLLAPTETAMPCFYARFDVNGPGDGDALAGEISTPEQLEGKPEDEFYEGEGRWDEEQKSGVLTVEGSEEHKGAPTADAFQIDGKYKLCACGHTQLMHTMPEEPEDPGAVWGECAACTCQKFTDVDSVIAPEASEPATVETKAAKRGTRKHQQELLTTSN